MADIQLPSELLVSLLRVLERVEGRLEKLEKLERLERLERQERQNKPSEQTEIIYPPYPAEKRSDIRNHPNGDEPISSHANAKATSTNQASTRHQPIAAKVPYSSWSINSHCSHVEEKIVSMREKHMGGYWRVPKDNRLPLITFKTAMYIENIWGPQVAMYPTTRPNLEVRLDVLRRFDAQHRVEKGNDFLVIDYDLMNTRIYRIGEAAIGSELMVDPTQLNNAPWSRLILYQGMTTGNSINPDKKKFPEGLPELISYFERDDTSTGLWTYIFSHLRLKPWDITTNPYLDSGTGFHTTFYEIRKDKHLGVNELWKQGPIYDHPLGWYFRKSAYTLYVPTSEDWLSRATGDSDNLTRHWTILLLAPDFFFDENNTSFPINALPPGRAQTLGHCLGRLTRLGAEMNLIGQGFQRISERWAAFQSYFDYILDVGGSLMQPTEHDHLLFDDGAFSRSRRYFWAIDCLSEFEASISDNIDQWELYKKARISPLFSSKVLPELDFVQFRNAERQYHILQNQREYFRRKLASTKALRDALFNASAVIESRASTRLGENVKLLTFVSTFFIPLSFCTSLWSINDKFSTEVFIIVIIFVALLTYFTMFNVNNLVNVFSRLYASKKRTVVQEMKSNQVQAWKRRGELFEGFRPKHENPQPSEWYITLYAILHPALLLGLRRSKGDDRQNSQAVGLSQYLTNIFKRRKVEPKEPEAKNDQPWVL